MTERPWDRLTRMAPLERRRFLKVMGAALAAPLAAPLVPKALRRSVQALVCGEARAQALEGTLGTLFIEINLRDQWDQGHVFVAPGLATYPSLRRGSTGTQAAIYATTELKRVAVNGTSVFLTADSQPLEPHLDSIAMIDCCELTVGPIHGHEAANPLRSPGKSPSQQPGTLLMSSLDPSGVSGNEIFYSSTPTPAALHNAYQKKLDPSLRNGIAFKGISRPSHTVFHFAANLPGAELDRKQSKQSLFDAFPATTGDANILPRPEDAQLFAEILRRVDSRHLERLRFSANARGEHDATLAGAQALLHVGQPKVVHLPLDDAEAAFWSDGIPEQVCDPSQIRAQIWEQAAYAYKLLASGLCRTMALEFDYVDVHDKRPEPQMRTMAKQTALPLARLITKLKEAHLYDRTLIAIYTLDGSRSPAAGSQGNQGKNTILLAGGMIRGGYYGDVQVAGDTADGHTYSYLCPDATTGAPGPARTDNTRSLPSARVWRTVMAALQVPQEVCDPFPSVRGAAPLPFLLRG